MIRNCLLLCLFILSLSCSRKKIEKTSDVELTPKFDKNFLVPLDYKDEKYNGFRTSMRDWKTKDGWNISYMVMNDSTRFHDIYIVCSKQTKESIYVGNGLLDCRTSFMPIYEGENSNYIFWKHSCTTSCEALLVFSKQKEEFKDYKHIVDFNLEESVLVYLPEQEDYGKLMLNIIDFNKGKEAYIRFKNRCMAANYRFMCIDSINIGSDKIEIGASLIDINDDRREREVYERKTYKRR